MVAAACTLHGFRDLDDYLRLRISTSKILRERVIQSLTKGYDLRCCAVGNCFVDGSIKEYKGGFPVEFDGGVQIGNIIQIENRFFRVVSTVENTVELNTAGRCAWGQYSGVRTSIWLKLSWACFGRGFCIRRCSVMRPIMWVWGTCISKYPIEREHAH